jgi:hypothetical protein
LLVPVNRFDRIPELRSAPSFDFDEHDEVVALDDQVDVPMSGAKATLDDAPSLASEPTLRDSLPKLAEFLPAARRHGAQGREPRRRPITESQRV